MLDLTGRKALITGASGGIGSAIAEALHGQGAIVGISGTRLDALEKLAHRLGDRVVILPGRLDTTEGPQKLIQEAEVALEGIDILINNAGLTRDNLLMRLKDEDWESVLQINLTAVFKLCREVLRGMMRRRWGRIISISSVVGKTGNAGQANYAATKSGLEGFSKSLALEVASRGITVNLVAPGFIDTAMTHVLSDEQKNKLLETIPLKRMGTPEDIAASVAFLASDEASYITGNTLHVNGGMVMV
ncbi:MAG: 3-oxoacyl-[acyl-carrier-protein] reductase [Holosporales bacterium]